MTSTELKIGLGINARPSSRVIKPPGGGHSNIFAEPEISVNAPRPKYNQQNSSNLNACMGSTDPNQVVEKLRGEITSTKSESTSKQDAAVAATISDEKSESKLINNDNSASRGRIPPGGHSSGGFW